MIPGGFSYGDDIAAGRILANELRFKLGDALAAFIAGGRRVSGICNGYQVLVKTGFLPGGNQAPSQTVTLAHNDSGRFQCHWVRMTREKSVCGWLNDTETAWDLPMAHGEGKFVAQDAAPLAELEKNGQSCSATAARTRTVRRTPSRASLIRRAMSSDSCRTRNATWRSISIRNGRAARAARPIRSDCSSSEPLYRIGTNDQIAARSLDDHFHDECGVMGVQNHAPTPRASFTSGSTRCSIAAKSPRRRRRVRRCRSDSVISAWDSSPIFLIKPPWSR